MAADKSLDILARAAGVKRRFLEKDRALLNRLAKEINPFDALARAILDGFKPRQCVKRDLVLHHAGGKVQREWVLSYSDGTEETVTSKWSVQDESDTMGDKVGRALRGHR